MERNYRPLRPASGTETWRSQQTQPEQSKVSTRKPKRPGFACNACRARKTACDRKQPTCTPCAGRSIECVYQKESKADEGKQELIQEVELLRRQQGQNLELIRQLIDLPEHEAIEVLRRLRITRNVDHVLAFLKGAMHSRQRSSEDITSGGPSFSTSSPLEFKLITNRGTTCLILAPVNTEIANPDNTSRPRTTDLVHNPPSIASSNRTPSWDNGTDPLQDIVGNTTLKPSLDQPPSLSQDLEMIDHSSSLGPFPPRQYCDGRLYRLQIGYWTRVNIDNDLAAAIISFFFETEHSICGNVDPDLFLTDLVECRERFCSSFLVNSLFWLACQLYTGVDIRAFAMASSFFDEAEKLWRQDNDEVNIVTLAATQILSIGCNMAGKDELAEDLAKNGRRQAEVLGLFGIAPDCDLALSLQQQTPEWRRAAAHVAWGTYNWFSLCCFYHDEPIWHPPSLPIPGIGDNDNGQPIPYYKGQIFPSLCRFWIISQEVAALYHHTAGFATALPDRLPLSLAEKEYQKLLNWANILIEGREEDECATVHVLLLHELFHSLVVQIFQPYANNESAPNRSYSFSSMDGSPDEVYAASINQLKRGVYLSFTERKGLPCSIFHNIGLLQLSHALLRSHSDLNWRDYVQLCVRAWTQLLLNYRIYSGITQTFMSVALRDGTFSSAEAQELMMKLRHAGRHYHITGEQLASNFVTDIDLAMTDATEPRLQTLADQFDDLAMFNEFTTGEYNVTRNSSGGSSKSIEARPNTWKGRGVDGGG